MAHPVVDEFLARQREMYAGGPVEPVAALLDDAVLWHVPGASPIAGHHRGRAAVLAYFARRLELAGGRIDIVKHGELAHGDTLVQLADGSAVIGGRPVTWRTAGVYRVADGRIAEAWLIPLDLAAFDAAWSGAV